MQDTIFNEPNIDVLEGYVTSLITENQKTIKGVIFENEEIYSKAVIIASGTYLASCVLCGFTSTPSGPEEQPTTTKLSECLRDLGIELIRLKTGTPQRIEKSSIDFSKTKVEYGDDRYWTFSFDNEIYYDKDKQIPCHLIYTNEKTITKINISIKSLDIIRTPLTVRGFQTYYRLLLKKNCSCRRNERIHLFYLF